MSIEGFCRGNNSHCITLEERYCSVKGSYFEYDGKVQSQIMYLHTCVGGPEKITGNVRSRLVATGSVTIKVSKLKSEYVLRLSKWLTF